MQDLLGNALRDYYYGKASEDLLTETSISEEDIMHLSYLFRSYAEMPSIEQKAMQLAKGKVLDVGCGAGSHSLYLQQRGLEVHAIDTSEGAVEVAKLRGVRHTQQVDILHYPAIVPSEENKFDTILLLMNGTGIFQKLDKTDHYLQHLKSLLSNGGQILIDSSDLQYMYDQTEEGGIIVPADHYYGELDFVMKYKGVVSEPFPWLYIDEKRFATLCRKNGFHCEIVARGENFDYLAQLKIASDSPA